MISSEYIRDQKDKDYELHKYSRDISTIPYYYQRLR